MALTITGFPDCRAALGPSQFERGFQIVPGTSDYPPSGYPITANQLSLGNLYGARVLAGNAAAALYTPKFVLPAASFGTPSTDPSTSPTINMEVTVADVQVANGVDLSACKWIVKFEAQGE
jgi:hypothetical protein